MISTTSSSIADLSEAKEGARDEGPIGEGETKHKRGEYETICRSESGSPCCSSVHSVARRRDGAGTQ